MTEYNIRKLSVVHAPKLRVQVSVICPMDLLALALFINCWIPWLSIGSFSVSCYTTIEPEPRSHPSFLMGTGDCGAALLPWQQALSHSPHIVWSVHVVPSKLERATADWFCSQTGPRQGYLPPALIPDALLIPPPTLHFLFSLLLMHSISHWQLSHTELCFHTHSLSVSNVYPTLLVILPRITVWNSHQVIANGN